MLCQGFTSGVPKAKARSSYPRGLIKCSRRIQSKTGQSLTREEGSYLGLYLLVSPSPLWRHQAPAARLSVATSLLMGVSKLLQGLKEPWSGESALPAHVQGSILFCYFRASGRERLQQVTMVAKKSAFLIRRCSS